MADVGKALTAAPDGFPLHKTVARLLDAKAEMFKSGEGFDWATAEALAFGSLLNRRIQGPPVRSGLRPRHLQRSVIPALINQETEDRYYPLNHIREGSGRIRSHRLHAVGICGSGL